MSRTIRDTVIDTTPVMFLMERVMREILTSGIINLHGSEGRSSEYKGTYTINLAELRIVIGKSLAMARRNGINERTDT